MMVVDPSDTCSDPIVETGSANWTSAATNSNDENILIIHSDTLANIYYQSIVNDYTVISGHSFSPVFGCGPLLGTSQVSKAQAPVNIYPNPTNDEFTISYNLNAAERTTITVTDVTGRLVGTIVSNELQTPGEHTFTYTINNNGIYFVRFATCAEQYTNKLVVTGK
jgi:Secretion system C-terminal sorting domain/PLD-like domain